jgi:hypothetical protein
MPTFAGFREALPAHVAGLPDVMGLVWAGASAEPQRADEWSDHDFFLIVRSGTQGMFRQALEWLPESSDIAFASRETMHGLKVVYSDGFVLEFAIFDEAELSQAVVNHHALAFGEESLATTLRGIVRTTAPDDSRSIDDHLGLFYALLLIGSGRFHRGERLAGGQFVRSYAVTHLLEVAHRLLPSAQPEARDALDPFRRVEREFPAFAGELDLALACEVPVAARRLSDMAARWFGEHSAVPSTAAAVLSRRLRWS